MASLKRLRVALEEMEALDRLLVDVLDTSSSSSKTQAERIRADKQVLEYFKASQEHARTCLDIYKDADGTKMQELALTGPGVFGNFEAQLKELKAHHRRYPRQEPDDSQDDRLKAAHQVEIKFTGEEVNGKFVDLNALYTQYANLPHFKKYIDYRTYLDKVGILHEVPAKTKATREYSSYIMAVEEYLRTFYQKTNPLRDSKILVQQFEKAHSEHKMRHFKSVPGYLDLETISSANDLVKQGMERVTAGLEALGLKCGGRLEDRAARLFSVKGLDPDNYDSSVLASGRPRKRRRKNKGGKFRDAKPSGQALAQRKVWAARLLTEFKIGKWVDALGDVFEDTKRHVEQKQIRTWEEIQLDRQEREETEKLAAADGGNKSDKQEDVIYNPTDGPEWFGWDPKPIPYWRYKLLGLGIEYKCEICGNEGYWGRRSFDSHFRESRHAHGMRCLGIPNTKHFHDITGIKDARDLYAKIKSQVTAEVWKADELEEFEDSEVNVLNKKTFDDLRRQGLL